MKRFWLGLGVLVVLLAFGCGITAAMHGICRPMWQQLEQAAEQPESTGALSARASWEQARHFIAAFTDHEPMEEIDALFEELETYRHDPTLYARCCARLSACVRAIAEAQAVNWWNIF